MSVKIISNKDGILKVSVDGINPAIANAIRRIITSEVPTMAIEDVRIRQNNSALFNEILSHRLGLMPMVSEKNAETASFILKKEGPCTVYSGDMVGTDKTVKPLYDNMVLVKLLENQAVDLEADCIMGTGNEHAKWQSGIASYEYEKDKFTFTIESISGLSSEEVFKSALEILEGKSKELEGAL